MTETQQRVAQRPSMLSPAVAATFGFAVYAISMIAGNVFEWNMDARLDHPHSHTAWESVTDYAGEFAIGLVGVAIAIWAGRRAWIAQPHRLARTALILAVVAAVTIVAFWAGWSNVLGAVAAGLALEYRRRVGSLGAAAGTALALGAAAFVAGTALCLLG
jgi:NhaP-type Na+/H+ or K+/H+ antiporter